MAKAATSGQARAFNAMIISRLDEEVLKQIDGGKFQQDAIDKPENFIPNFIEFINNGCRMQVIGNHEVNTDAIPSLPFDGATIEFHKKGGIIKLNPSAIVLHLSENQKDGKVIQGYELHKELKKMPVLSACVLDYLLVNPHLIPEEWKGKYIYFWGTIFRDPNGDLYVRCLFWRGGKWQSDCNWLGHVWDGDSPAALSQVSAKK